MAITRSWARGDDAIDAVKTRLRRYRSLVNRYNACKDLFEQLYPGCTPVYSDMPKGGGGLSKMEACLDKRWSLMEQMQDNLAEQAREIDEVMETLNGLGLDEYTVLMRRYILGETIEAVAQKMNYSQRWCWKMHDKGIQNIARRGEVNEE